LDSYESGKKQSKSGKRTEKRQSKQSKSKRQSESEEKCTEKSEEKGDVFILNTKRLYDKLGRSKKSLGKRRTDNIE
jgi:hypothetical protein